MWRWNQLHHRTRAMEHGKPSAALSPPTSAISRHLLKYGRLVHADHAPLRYRDWPHLETGQGKAQQHSRYVQRFCGSLQARDRSRGDPIPVAMASRSMQLFSSWNKRRFGPLFHGEKKSRNGAVNRPGDLIWIRLRFARSGPDHLRLMLPR